MNFKTEGQELPNVQYISKYISALSIVEATVTTEVVKSALKGTPGLKLNFTTAPVEGITDEQGNPAGKTADHIFYVTDATFEGQNVDYNGRKSYMPGVKDRLLMIADATGTREQLDELGNTANNLDEYLNGVTKIFNGVTARWKFGGEEIAGKDGKPNWNKAVLARFNFVEPISISASESKLKISPKDLKSLPVTNDTVSTPSGVSTSDLY